MTDTSPRKPAAPIHRNRHQRPGLAVIVNAPSPYMIHQLRSFAHGIPEFKLHSLFTHAKPDFVWSIDAPPEIHAQHFSRPDESVHARIWTHPLRDYLKSRTIQRYMHEANVQAVICQGYYGLTNLLLMANCRRNGIPVFLRGDSNVLGEHGLGSVRSRLKRRALGTLLRRVDGVMHAGTLGKRYFLKYGASPESCFLVPLAPDYDSWSSVSEPEVESFRERHRMDRDRNHLLFSGRLTRVKRVDLLIRAFNSIAAERPDWDVVLAGDGDLRDSLEDLVPVELKDRYIWLGFRQVDELRAAYHACDVLVLPSEHEPWALVVNEAMAAGLVVVASDVVGAAYDLVEDGRNGSVFPSGDAVSLAHSILTVTDPCRIADIRSQVRPKLQEWRTSADPIQGVREALRSVGLLGAERG